MLDKILFLYHGTQRSVSTNTVNTNSGGLSGNGQIIIILIVLALIGWFLWKIRKKN